MMKILHVIDSGGFYGAEAMLVELALEQRKAGLSVTVCSIGTPGEGEKAIEKVCRERSIEVIALRMKAGLNIFGGMSIVKYAKQNGFNLFHSHGYKGNILLGILPRFIRGVPLVTTLHGWTSSSGLTKMKVYETLDAIILSRIDGVVLVSESMLNIKGIVGRTLNHLTVINNGLSSSPSVPSSEDPLLLRLRSLKKKGFLIGSIGRLSYEKGYDILLDAFKVILNASPSTSLVIMGEGSLRNELNSIAQKLGISESVHFIGYVENASKYISELDLYINSSRTEGTPITLLECLRIGKAVVATDVGGNTRLVEGKKGLLVQPEDSEGIAREVNNYLLDNQLVDPELQKKYFRDNFSSSMMERRYFEIYQTLLK